MHGRHASSLLNVVVEPFCNGEPICVSSVDDVTGSLRVTGFGYDHDDAWASNMETFKELTDVSQGVRRLGAAAIDLCH
eukprot:gene24712-10350_t